MQGWTSSLLSVADGQLFYSLLNREGHPCKFLPLGTGFSPCQYLTIGLQCHLLSQGLKSQPQTMRIYVMAQIPLCIWGFICRIRFPLHFLQAGLPRSHLNLVQFFYFYFIQHSRIFIARLKFALDQMHLDQLLETEVYCLYSGFNRFCLEKKELHCKKKKKKD